MKTINSVSGGKTSAYMAIHYPADYNLFSVVLTEDLNCIPKDKGLFREAQERIPGFIGSRELDSTLKAVLDLEQKMGKLITWVCAYEGSVSNKSISNADWMPTPLTYDRLIQYRKALPNFRTRFCTQELKLYAIFWHTYLHIMDSPEDIVDMRIGFRKDELSRAAKMLAKCPKIEFSHSCNALSKNKRNQNHRLKLEWRCVSFPLITANISRYHVLKFWQKQKDIKFPLVSNCDICFFHTQDQEEFLRYQQPGRMAWSDLKALEIGHTWKNPRNNSSACHCTD